MYKHILVATDLSEAAQQVYNHAAVLALSMRARITLLHVDEARDFAFPPRSLRTHRQLRQLLRDAEIERRRLLDQACEWFEGLGLQVESETVAGDPTVEILELVNDREVDLLALGRRGARRIERLTLGHNTKRLLRRTTVPTLVVPRHRAGPHPTSGGLPAIRRIISTTSFSASCMQGLRASLALAELLDAHVEYTHVVRLPVPFLAAGFDWPGMIGKETREEVQHTLAENLNDLVGEAGAARCTPTTVIGVSVAEALAKLCAEVGAGLITVPASESRLALLGNTSDNIVGLSPVPVLVFPQDYLQRCWG